ncbi:MAG TPA: Fe-Mn family superoxide dismutase [Pyrinomonadaceae bacterium]|nr:Fe-Mn family superoxide dismutase [Pyrinomonadaceae bacterium]
MKTYSRRRVIGTLAAGSATLALTSLGHKAVASEESDETGEEKQAASTVAIARVFRGQHQPAPLPFDPAKLKGISEKLIKSHWENNYSGAVKALNAVEQRLASLLQDKDLPPYIYGDLKREELVRTGSVVLHENYFANLGGDGRAAGTVLDSLKQWFGSYEQWEAEFKRTGNALGGGSGWVILGYNQHTREMHNYWSWDHMHNAPMSRPLLVLDMYEHAYQMDYGAAAAKYIDAFMQNVNWEEVNRRTESAMKS